MVGEPLVIPITLQGHMQVRDRKVTGIDDVTWEEFWSEIACCKQAIKDGLQHGQSSQRQIATVKHQYRRDKNLAES